MSENKPNETRIVTGNQTSDNDNNVTKSTDNQTGDKADHNPGEFVLSTKERIEQTALDLFAMHGYSAVSIRDICKVVGIKESSVYYHYANKQAIMDAMLDKVDGLIRQMEAAFDQSFEKATQIPDIAMIAVAKRFLLDYYLNPYVYRIIRMLSIERNSDLKAEEVYQRLMFELPISQQSTVFGKMVERGFINPANPEVLAQEYLAIIYMAFMKNCMGIGMDEIRIEKAKAEIAEGIGDIYLKMKKI